MPLRPLRATTGLALAGLLSSSPAVHAVDALGLSFKGNFQFDLIQVDEAPAAIDDIEHWRRREFGFTTALPASGEAKVEYDFESEAWTDVYLRFPLGPGKLTLGQAKVPFSADFLTSSTQLAFTENSVAGQFAPGRRLGLNYAFSRDHWGLAGAAYGHDLEHTGPDFGLGARGWWSTGAADSGFWHLALGLTREAPQDDSQRFRTRPEVASYLPTWLDGGRFAAVDAAQRTGLEAGFQYGDWLLQSEWLQTRFDDGVLGSRSARGGYLQASWVLHGAPRVYDKGLFTLPKAVDGVGQIELAARYSQIDLPRSAGGEWRQDGVSLALNAQLTRYLRLSLDRHLSERGSDDQDARLWTLRVNVLL